MSTESNDTGKAIEWSLNDLKSNIKSGYNGCGLYLNKPIHPLLYDNKIRENSQLIQIRHCDVSKWKHEAIISYLHVFLNDSNAAYRKLLLFTYCTSHRKYKTKFRFIRFIAKIRKYTYNNSPRKYCKSVILIDCNTNTLLFEIMYIKRHNYGNSTLIFSPMNSSVTFFEWLAPTITWTNTDIILLKGIRKQKFEQHLMKKHIRLPWIKKKCEQCNKKTNKHGKPLRICGGCKTILYCSKHCQKIGWKRGHKSVCSK